MGLAPRDRINFLCQHFTDMDAFRKSYRENVISIIGYMRTFDRSKNKKEGMSLSNSGHVSDSTAQAAFERLMIEELWDNKTNVSDILSDAEDQEIISWAVLEWNALKREHDMFKNQIKLLGKDEREIISGYMMNKITTEDIAERFCIEYESAIKRVYRIKRKLVRRMLPLMRVYVFRAMVAL